MIKLLLSLHDYLSTNKWLWFVLLSACGVLFAIGINRLSFEENINSVLPQQAFVNKVFQQTKLADQIIVHLSSSSDSTELLIDQANFFIETIEKDFYPSHIQQIEKYNPDQFNAFIERCYSYLPIFLQSNDYKLLDSLTSDSSIKSAINTGYQTLLTPAGSFFKKSFLSDPLGIARIPLNRISNFQLDDNFLIDEGFLVSKDGKHILLIIEPTERNGEISNTAELIDGLQQLKSLQMSQQSAVAIDYFGGPIVSVENAKRIKKDILLTVNLVSVLLFVFLSVYFRRIFTIPMLFLPIIIGGALAVATFSLFKTTISSIALGIGAVILGVTIDFSLHIFNHIRLGFSAKTVLEKIGPAILASSLTTAAAFLCLQFVDSNALNDLGMFAALSVIFGAIAALIILPLLLENHANNNVPPSYRWIQWMTHFPFHKKPYVLIPLIGMMILAFAFLPKLKVSNDLEAMNYMSPELSLAKNKLDSVSNTVDKALYMLSSGESLEAALKQNEEATFLLQQSFRDGEIKEYNDFSSFILSQDLQEKRIQQWNEFWNKERVSRVVSSLAEAASSKGLKPGTFSSFEQMLSKNYSHYHFSVDSLGMMEKFFIREKNSIGLINIIKIEHGNTQPIIDEFRDNPDIIVLDRAIVANSLVSTIEKEFSSLSIVSLLVVLLILLVFLKRIELVFFTSLPIILSWVLTFGVMAILNIHLNIFNMIVAIFIFGLGVDYSIFIMRALQHDYVFGTDELPNFKTSILLSAITTILGTGVLLFAQHPALRSIATISVIGISSVFVLTYTILPFIFYWFVVRRANKILRPATLSSSIKSVLTVIPLLTGIFILSSFALVLKVLFFIPKKYWKPYFHQLLNSWGKAYTHWVFPGKRYQFFNDSKEDFSKAALILSNHQSLLDTPAIFALHPKIIILTKDWVYNSPLFGIIARAVDFYSIEDNYEDKLPLLQKKFNQGYSIVMFPEGTRSKTQKTGRFYRGAFHISELLKADIVPLVIHGTGEFLRKDEAHANSQDVSLSILERIPYADKKWGDTYSERYKSIRNYYKTTHRQIRTKLETPSYFRHILLSNYWYKGFIVEYSNRLLFRLENRYNWLIPMIGEVSKIKILGSRYGLISNLLNLTYEDVDIEGVEENDYQRSIAEHSYTRSSRLNYQKRDQMDDSDCILVDTTYHIDSEGLIQLIHNLKPNGKLIIRSSMKKLSFGKEWVKRLAYANETVNQIELNDLSDSLITQKIAVDIERFEIDKFFPETIMIVTKN